MKTKKKLFSTLFSFFIISCSNVQNIKPAEFISTINKSKKIFKPFKVNLNSDIQGYNLNMLISVINNIDNSYKLNSEIPLNENGESDFSLNLDSETSYNLEFKVIYQDKIYFYYKNENFIINDSSIFNVNLDKYFDLPVKNDTDKNNQPSTSFQPKEPPTPTPFIPEPSKTPEFPPSPSPEPEVKTVSKPPKEETPTVVKENEESPKPENKSPYISRFSISEIKYLNPETNGVINYIINAGDDKPGIKYEVFLDGNLVSTENKGSILINKDAKSVKVIVTDSEGLFVSEEKNYDIKINKAPIISYFNVTPQETRVQSGDLATISFEIKFEDEQKANTRLYVNNQMITTASDGQLRLTVGSYDFRVEVTDEMGLTSYQEKKVLIK